MSNESTSRIPWWRRWFGNRSERAARTFLKRQGYRILARNFTCKFGELDVVALDGKCIVFVEVRSTGGSDSLRPALSVDFNKQRRLTRLAKYYLQKYQLWEQPTRFDVVTVCWPESADKPEITHYTNAFEAVD